MVSTASASSGQRPDRTRETSIAWKPLCSG